VCYCHAAVGVRAHQGGQHTYEMLSQGELKDEFLVLPKKTPLLLGKIVIQSLFIRESYKRITTLIVDAMTKKNIKRFIVTGTPGIGKSIFLHYFLWLLITRKTSINDQVDRKVYFQSDSTSVLRFDKTETIYIPKGVAVSSLFQDENCILLVDMVEELEPAECKGTVIIFSSPNVSRYKQFLNGLCSMYILNPWSLNEIKAVWSRSYQHLQWQEVERVFIKMGGIIRYVLEQNEVADKRLNQGICKARNMFTDMAIAISSQVAGGINGHLIYRVVHYYSPDNRDDNCILSFASPYCRKLCLQGLSQEGQDRVLAFLQYNQAPDAQGYRGYLSEPYVHINAAAFGFDLIRRLGNVKYADCKVRQYAVPDTYVQVFKGVSSKIETPFDNLKHIKLLKDVYYRPVTSNFESIDSFAIIGDDVFAFQVTVGLKGKGIKCAGLEALFVLISKTYPNLNYHIVFVCPKGESNTSKFKAVKISDGEDTFKTFKSIPEDAKRFEGNQWVAEFVVKTSYDIGI